jgi:zinc transporter
MDAMASPAHAVAVPGLAYLFDGKGKAVEAAQSDVAAQLFVQSVPGTRQRLAKGFAWLHCHIEDPLLHKCYSEGHIDALVFDHLSEADTRPICIPHDPGLLLNLRGRAIVLIDDESDLVAVRLWITRRGIVSTWRRPTRAMQELLAEVSRGFSPKSVGEFVGRLTLRIVDTIEPMVDELAETVDDLEIEVVDGSQKIMRRELSDVRRQAIDLRRFLYPQRDALSTFLIEHVSFVKEEDRVKLHEGHDRMTRFIEELEVLRERCAVLHDEIIDNRSERMNKQILLLSVVSALFLPASLIAGMLGMNVSGIPLHDHPSAFAFVSLSLLVLILVEIVLFRWLKII